MSQAGVINLAGGGGGGSPIMTITGNDGVATSPTANNVNIVGATVANATNAIPVYVKHTATSTDTIQVQVAEAAASSNINNAGLASFNNADFTIDANGYVSITGGAAITTIDGDTGSITGATVTIYANNAALNCGATVKFVNSGTTSTLNVTDQYGNCIVGEHSGNAALSLTGGNVSLGTYNLTALTTGEANVVMGQSAGQDITTGIDNTAIGTQALYQLTTGSANTVIGDLAGSNYLGSETSNVLLANTGVAAENNVMRLGTQGSGTGDQNKCFIAGVIGVTASNPELVTINSSTTQLGIQALTQYDVLTGGASNALNQVAPSATSGVPLISHGSSSQPAFGTAVVAGGGTGGTSFTAYSVLCGGTTSTGALQNVSGVGTSGQVLTSNGASALPTWQAAGGGGGVSGPGSSTNNGIATWNGTGGTALFSPPTPLVSSAGIQTNSNQPAFLAYLSANSGNVTGDNTIVIAPFNSVSFDQGSNFNTGSNYYVCPVAGLYQYNVNMFLAQSGAGTNTFYDIFIVVNGSTTYTIANQNYWGAVFGTNFQWGNGSILIKNAASDTVQVNVAVGGNASKNIVIGGQTVGATFSGFLVC